MREINRSKDPSWSSLNSHWSCKPLSTTAPHSLNQFWLLGLEWWNTRWWQFCSSIWVHFGDCFFQTYGAGVNVDMRLMRGKNGEIERNIQNLIVATILESEDHKGNIWSATFRKWVLLKLKFFKRNLLCLRVGNTGQGLLYVAELGFLFTKPADYERENSGHRDSRVLVRLKNS